MNLFLFPCWMNFQNVFAVTYGYNMHIVHTLERNEQTSHSYLNLALHSTDKSSRIPQCPSVLHKMEVKDYLSLKSYLTTEQRKIHWTVKDR